MATTLITYDGGETLHPLFKSLVMLFNTNGGFLNPLMAIAISCGAFVAIAKAFFSPNAEVFLPRFIFPLLAISRILLLPTTSVKIEDVLTKRSYKVDNVPWFLARTTEFISTIGYRITQAVESIMHIPNDLTYNTTGMVFGSETALDIGKYQITNAVLEQDLKPISNQCVFFDLALGKYSLNSLKATTDLWAFLKSNTSKVRMRPYIDPEKPNAVTTLLPHIRALGQRVVIVDTTGEHELHEYNEGISYGAHEARDGVNLSTHKRSLLLVSVTDLQSLKRNQAFVKLPENFPITKIKLGVVRDD